MSRAQIQAIYDGEAVQAGSMDVQELAPALLSIGDLYQGANKVLNGDRAKVSVHVRSGFQRGSFEISLEIIQDLMTQVKSLFIGDDIIAAHNLFKLVFGGGSLFGLIRWLKGRKPGKTTTLESGNVRIEIQNAHIEVRPEVAKLYQDSTVRKAALGVVKPLDKEGIDRFDVKEQEQVVESVTKDELPYFVMDAEQEDSLIDEERTAVFEIVKLSFDERYKWTFSDGSGNFNADVEDDEFFQKVQGRQISFAKGDILKVRIHTQTLRTEKGLKTTHKIVKVLEIIPGPIQLSLPPSE